MALTATALTHEKVRLELLSMDHLEGLQAATQDGQLDQLWYTIIPNAENMTAEITRRLGLYEKGSMIPYTIIQTTDGIERIIGMTTFMNIDSTATYNRVEIGSTWYAQSAQRNGSTPLLNASCWLMLLKYGIA